MPIRKTEPDNRQILGPVGIWSPLARSLRKARELNSNIPQPSIGGGQPAQHFPQSLIGPTTSDGLELAVESPFHDKVAEFHAGTLKNMALSTTIVNGLVNALCATCIISHPFG